MRILFENYIYSSDSLEGISLFNTYRAFVQGCTKAGLPLKAYYSAPRPRRTPDKKNPIGWTPERLKELGFDALPVGTPYMPRITYPYFEPEFVNQVRDKDFVCDLVWTCNYPHTASLQVLQHSLVSKWDVECPLPIVNYWMETTLDKDLFQMSYPECAGSIAMSSACTPMAVMNKFDLDELRKINRKFLSPAMCAKSASQQYLVPPSFDASKIDALREDFIKERLARVKSQQINIFHGGAKDKKRHVAELIRAVGITRSMGANVHVYLTTQNKLEYDDLDWVHVENGCVGDDYLKTFGKGDLLWMASDYEGTGIGYMEAIYSGMIPVCSKQADWVIERIPKNYPLWVDSPKNVDQVAKVLYAAAKGWDQLTKFRDSLIARFSEWSDTKVAEEKFYPTALEVVKKAEGKNIEIAKKSFAFQFLELAVKNDKIPDTVKLEDCWQIMTDQTDKGMTFEWVGLRGLSYMLKSLGWTDTLDDDLTFKRIDNV